jgi:FkbM family methyltransferase
MQKCDELLNQLLEPERLTAVVDIGANPIDGDPPYHEMLRKGLCTVTGFEPQPEALASLLQRKGPLERYLPSVVGDGSDHVLHITQSSGMTSLLEPDPARLALFNGFAGWGAVRERVTTPTTRLDDLGEVGQMDLLKIDVQGAELMVFQGGRDKLRGAVAVQTEVSFVALYKEQPTFGDIDADLRSQGFLPHAMTALKRWAIAPVIYDGDFRRPMHQLLEADLVYVRDFTETDDFSSEQLQHLALVAHHVYGSSDLVHLCLLALARRSLVREDGPAAYLASWTAAVSRRSSR